MAYLGQSISGGTLFYSGATELIAANSDIYIAIDWGHHGTEIIGTDTAIGTGLANTSIIANLSGYTAAVACNDLLLDGYSDWYLPSKDELSALYSGRTYVSELDTQNNYWSSSQYNSYCAYMQYFLTGVQSPLGATNKSYKIRPIRTL